MNCNLTIGRRKQITYLEGDKRKMTEEELKNKCKERARIFQQAMKSCKSSNLIDCIEWFADRIAELEAQIEKMKCCYNCKHSRTEYEHCRTDKHEKWEIKEK